MFGIKWKYTCSAEDPGLNIRQKIIDIPQNRDVWHGHKFGVYFTVFQKSKSKTKRLSIIQNLLFDPHLFGIFKICEIISRQIMADTNTT